MYSLELKNDLFTVRNGDITVFGYDVAYFMEKYLPELLANGEVDFELDGIRFYGDKQKTTVVLPNGNSVTFGKEFYELIYARYLKMKPATSTTGSSKACSYKYSNLTLVPTSTLEQCESDEEFKEILERFCSKEGAQV